MSESAVRHFQARSPRNYHDEPRLGKPLAHFRIDLPAPLPIGDRHPGILTAVGMNLRLLIRTEQHAVDEKVPGETDNPWKHDILDDTDTNQRKEPKDPKRTLFY